MEISTTIHMTPMVMDSAVRMVRVFLLHRLTQPVRSRSEILMLIARGLTNEEIAGELIISPATVKTHVARIMGKLDAHDRAQLVVCAYESGLVSPRAN